MKPSEYGLPHDSWRPSQQEALDLILGMKSGTIILEMATGTGKTSLAAATGLDNKVLALMSSRDLQQQYADLYDFEVIWGRSHYECYDEKRVKKWRKTYGYTPAADDCPSMKECDIQCPYKQAKIRAVSSNKVCSNFHYAWYSEWWHKRGGYLFADEAHNLAITTISNLAQLRVSERQRHRWNLPKFPHCSGTTEWAKDKVYEWLDKAIPVMGGTLGQMDDSKDKSKGTLLHRKLVMLRKLLQDGTWYISGTNIGSKDNPPHLSCRPVNPKVFAHRLLGHHDKKVLMSATIGDAEMLARELGIDDYEFHSFPHNIPADRRPVFLTDAPAMSYRSKWADYEEQADVIANICLRHPYERILVHVTRWKHANDLADRLARKGLQDRVWVPSTKQNRIQQIQELTNPRHPYRISIGPSFWEGIDYREASVVIVAKVPFADRSDPVVSARLRQPNGGKWDRWCAALKVVQGCGRAVRDEDDYAVSYIADQNFVRVAKYVPSWFNVEE